jgi:hypothetical protein
MIILFVDPNEILALPVFGQDLFSLIIREPGNVRFPAGAPFDVPLPEPSEE